MKWGFLPAPDGGPRYLVVNADESEPGTCKDIPLMMASPQHLIEGMIITSYAIGCHHAFIYVRGEVLHVYRRLLNADRGGVRGRATSARTSSAPASTWRSRVHAGAGAYICGEETALLDSLEGLRGQPRLKPPFPAVAGLYARPTVVNNVESIASVPGIVAGRRGLVHVDGHREVHRPRAVLAVRARDAAGPVRGAAGHHAARAARDGRRHPRGPRAEVLDARAARRRRSSPPSTSTSRSTTSRSARRARCSARARCRSSTRPPRWSAR